VNEQFSVIFDLETVPDVALGRLILGANPTDSESDIRARLGEKYARDGQDPKLAFIKIPLQKIVCIGAVYAQRQSRTTPWIITRSGVGHIGLRTEGQLISGFVESLGAQPTPQLVGFNSSSFDLPVLRYRAFALSVPVANLHRANGKDYWYRFGRDHMDLCDVLSNFGASPKPSLDEVAALCGIPGKASGIDGSQVEAMVDANRLEEVANYCESDVMTTYLLFLRFGLMTGEMSEEAYLQSLLGFREFIKGRLEKRPHLGRYLSAMAETSTSVSPHEAS
jgi:3'-5' exonuclease